MNIKNEKYIIIRIVIILSLFSFVSLLYQSLYVKHYVYAFKPSNAPDTETLSISENITTYQFINSWGSHRKKMDNSCGQKLLLLIHKIMCMYLMGLLIPY